jgi:hypothetical protein
MGHLRLFPHAEETSYEDAQEPTVRISLRDLLPLIALAKRQHYVWLQDFLEDEVCITPDLYDILQTFRSYRPSA